MHKSIHSSNASYYISNLYLSINPRAASLSLLVSVILHIEVLGDKHNQYKLISIQNFLLHPNIDLLSYNRLWLQEFHTATNLQEFIVLFHYSDRYFQF